MSDVDSIINSLKGIGTSKAVLEGKPSSPMAKLLTELMQDVTDQLRQSVDKYGADASGNLKQGISPTKVTQDADGISIAIEAPFYWKFVNYGVNGTIQNNGAPNWGSVASTGTSFEQSITQWIQAKGITLPPQFSSYESFNYVIRRSIKEKGQKARPFFTDVVNDELKAYLKKPIEKLLKRSIELTIIEPFK